MLMGRTPEVEPVTQPFKASSQVRLSQQEAVSTPVLSGTPDSEVLSAGLSPGADKLLKLVEWFHRRNYDCYPKQEWMAAKIGSSLGSVRRWMAELISKGIVKSYRRGGTSALYILVEKAWKALRGESSVRVLNPSLSLLVNENNSNKLARKPPSVEKTILDKAEPEYVQEFARAMKYLPCRIMERLSAAAASIGLPADVAGQFARSIELQPRWMSPHRSIRNPLAYRVAVIEKEILGVRRSA